MESTALKPLMFKAKIRTVTESRDHSVLSAYVKSPTTELCFRSMAREMNSITHRAHCAEAVVSRQ